MKKLWCCLLILNLLSGCSIEDNPNEDSKTSEIIENQPNENFSKTMKRVPVKTIVLNDKMKIERYQTTYPHNKEQIMKIDYFSEDDWLPYERVGAEDLVFIGFDVYKNDDITSIVQTSNHVLWEAGGFPDQYRVINIDNQTGKILTNRGIIKSYDELSEAAMSSLEKLGYVPLYAGDKMNYTDFYYGIDLENQPKSSILPINDESMVYKKDNSYQLILEIYKAGVNDYKIKFRTIPQYRHSIYSRRKANL